MNTLNKYAGVILIVVGLLGGACGHKRTWSVEKSAASGQLKQFVAAKEAQARRLANQQGATPPPEFESFFAAARKGDWQTATNIFEVLSKKVRNSSGPRGTWWAPVLEAYGVYELLPSGDEKYSIAFGQDIVKSIPEGSVYFGGTDPGRFLVTAFMPSHEDGNPFFGLTQNGLADGTYLDYLRAMYGEKIYIPTSEDSQRCFQDHLADAQQRLAKHQLKPGENVSTDPNGHVQVSGQMAVMDINARLARVIFDQNTNHEFYIEESFPLDWMYPYLEPHGLIMKINREPLAELSEETLQTDHDYWAKYTTPMIGDWLNSDTTVQQVTAFAEKTYVKHDLSGFKGDPHFIASADAQKTFSKLRSSLAGVYSWRLGVAPSGGQIPAGYAPRNDADKQALAREADFAFKQAFALCPYSPEAAYRYVAFLTAQNRKSDALLIAQTAARADPKNHQFQGLAANLSR